MNYIEKYVNLCYDAAIDDPGTRHNLATLVIPRLKDELATWVESRTAMEAHPDAIQHWIDSGLVECENKVRAAIQAAQDRLAEVVS